MTIATLLMTLRKCQKKRDNFYCLGVDSTIASTLETQELDPISLFTFSKFLQIDSRNTSKSFPKAFNLFFKLSF